MRIKGEKIVLQYSKTKSFFQQRANKYQEEYPYCVTMYQDNNLDLTKERNKAEVDKILPLLSLDDNSSVLDIACGIGRWADAIEQNITRYLGIDFSENLIEIACKRNVKDNFSFLVGSTTEIPELVNNVLYNRIIIAGILMYLNDDDIIDLCSSILDVIKKDTIIYIREPVALKERLTLKDFPSVELNTDYSAIYRTKEEYFKLLINAFINNGATIEHEGALFSDSHKLNNRSETMQYYFIIKV